MLACDSLGTVLRAFSERVATRIPPRRNGENGRKLLIRTGATPTPGFAPANWCASVLGGSAPTPRGDVFDVAEVLVFWAAEAGWACATGAKRTAEMTTSAAPTMVGRPLFVCFLTGFRHLSIRRPPVTPMQLSSTGPSGSSLA